MNNQPTATSFGTLIDLLSHLAEKSRSHVRYLVGDDLSDSFTRSYSELLDEAQRVLAGLRAVGVQPRDRVVLLLERPEDFLPVFWACVLGGFLPCPLAPVPGDMSRWATQLEHVTELLEGPTLVTTTGMRTEMPVIDGLAVVPLESLRQYEPDHETANPARDDVVMLMLTSGSTGKSKAVMLSHGNLLTSVAGKAEREGLTADDITMNWIAFDHVAAVIECHLLCMFVGASQINVRPSLVLSDPMRFLELVDRYRVTMTFTPNFLLGLINKAMAQRFPPRSLDLSSLRLVVSGGEANVVTTAERFLSQLAPFGLSRDVLVPVYGMTETSGGCVYSREFRDVDAGLEFTSVGLPIRGANIRIVDEAGLPVASKSVGRLQVRGPMIFGGYFNNPGATAEAFTPDGWLDTGDLGRVENDRLHVVGRSKESIVINGVNYFGHDLETALERIEGVRASWVAAFPTRPTGNDTEQLVVVFNPEFSLDDEPGLHRLMATIRNAVVAHWGFRPAVLLPLPQSMIPKTSLGKIQRSLLRRRLEAGELAEYERRATAIATRPASDDTRPTGGTESTLIEIYAEIFGIDSAQLSAAAKFLDLGGTSLDIIQLKRKVEWRLGVADLPVTWLLRHPTVRELARYLDGMERMAAYDPVVPLQSSGARTPLFCVHPVGGDVLVFLGLAKHFTDDRPVYALRAPGFQSHEKLFTTFSELVECYTWAIRAQQPHGPYAVVGYSYGAPVAFEIAKLLEAGGDRVEFTGIIDCPPDFAYLMEEFGSRGLLTLAATVSLITVDQVDELWPRISTMSAQQRLDYIIGISPKDRLAELDLDARKLAGWWRVMESLCSLAKDYQPRGNVESLTVFHVADGMGLSDTWMKRLHEWDAFARASVRYVEVPGRHFTLLEPENLSVLQVRLHAELARESGEGGSLTS